MGEKGARRGAASRATADRLTDALAPLGDVSARAMFGGHGIFADGVMFGLVDGDGAPFLRADPADAERIAELEAAGAARHGGMPYWSVPDAAIDDDGALLERGRAALEVARSARR